MDIRLFKLTYARVCSSNWEAGWCIKSVFHAKMSCLVSIEKQTLRLVKCVKLNTNSNSNNGRNSTDLRLWLELWRVMSERVSLPVTPTTLQVRLIFCCFSNTHSDQVHLFSIKSTRRQSIKRQITLYMLRCLYLGSLTVTKRGLQVKWSICVAVLPRWELVQPSCKVVFSPCNELII